MSLDTRSGPIVYTQLPHTVVAAMIAVTILKSKAELLTHKLNSRSLGEKLNKDSCLSFLILSTHALFMNYIYFAPDYHGKVVD